MPRLAVDTADLLARVDAIAPVIVAHRNEAETKGELSRAVVAALQHPNW